MKKTGLIVAGLIMAAALAFTPSHASESVAKLDVVGTGAGMVILEALAKAFNADHPEVMITVPKSIGSGGGIKAVGNDEHILGRVARDIEEREKIYGLHQLPILKIPIVFFVNRNVPVTELTLKQACGIYEGTIRRWNEIGAGDGKIRVIKREAGDSSLLTLQATLPGFKEILLTEKSKTTFTDQSNVEACLKEKNAIAFGTWADVKNIAGVHVLKLDGLHPSDRSYPHIGILSLIYKEKNYAGNVQRFADFIFSDAGKQVIVNAGGLPME